MATWLELENAQPNASKYIKGTTGQESTGPAKGKETDKSKCRPSALGWPPCDPTRPSLAPHSTWPLLLVWTGDTGTLVTKTELLPSYSTVALIEEPTGDADPWDLPALQNTGIKWSGRNEARRSGREGTP